MKRKSTGYVIIFLTLLISVNMYTQEYDIGYTILNAVDSSRFNRQIRLHVYYPAATGGSDLPLSENAPISAAPEGGFPVISFGHGYMMPVDDYSNLWSQIVPAGYIFVLPETETDLFPSHSEFGLDIEYSARHLINEGTDSSSIFYGQVGNKVCLMGHSMGGGSALLGAENAANLSAIIVLAPLVTRPSSVVAAESVNIPALVITGSHDFITPSRKHALPIYQALGSPLKTYINIRGGNHCNMALKNSLCNMAERTKPKNSISREEQHQTLIRYILPWLNYNVKGIVSEGEKFDNLTETDTTITRKRSRPHIIN
jgi:pimeloyl-ACP methyl ester carboxylesterase